VNAAVCAFGYEAAKDGLMTVGAGLGIVSKK